VGRKRRVNLKPYGQFVWALFFWACAAVVYGELNRLESAGRIITVSSGMSTMYSLGGKWGAAAFFIFVGGACFRAGLNELRVHRRKGI
jgi:hypothetical protein